MAARLGLTQIAAAESSSADQAGFDRLVATANISVIVHLAWTAARESHLAAVARIDRVFAI